MCIRDSSDFMQNMPHGKMLVRLHKHLRETGSFSLKLLTGIDFYKKKERVLNRIEKNPEVSTRRPAVFDGVDHTTVFVILQSQQLKPYHLQRVQALEDVDCEQR